jgi:hypothetical protein
MLTAIKRNKLNNLDNKKAGIVLPCKQSIFAHAKQPMEKGILAGGF